MMLEAAVRGERAWSTDGGRSRAALAAEAQNRYAEDAGVLLPTVVVLVAIMGSETPHDTIRVSAQAPLRGYFCDPETQIAPDVVAFLRTATEAEPLLWYRTDTTANDARAGARCGPCLRGAELKGLVDRLLDPEVYLWRSGAICVDIIGPVPRFGVVFRRGAEEIVLVASTYFACFRLEGCGRIGVPFILETSALEDLARRSFPDEPWQ